MAVPGDAPGQVLVEVGVTPDVVDEENRPAPKPGRRQRDKLTQGRTITGSEGSLLLPDGRRSPRPLVISRRGTHPASLGSQSAHEFRDPIQRGIDDGE